MGYVYVIHAQGTNHYKIGITNNSVKNRLRELQTGNHSTLEVVRSYQTEEPAKIERALHEHLSSYRGKGEWFELTSATVVDDALEVVGAGLKNVLQPGYVMRKSGYEPKSDRFKFVKSIISDPNINGFGLFFIAIWALFVPLSPIISEVYDEAIDAEWWQAPAFDDEE